MGVNRWLDYMGGLITVRIKGAFPERVINQALSRGLIFTGLKRDETGIVLQVRQSGIKALKNIADQSEHEIDVVKREGLSFLGRKMSRRWMLIAGGLVFILALYTFSSFLWDVQVVGNRKVNSQVILKSAAHYGLSRWAFKGALDKNRVEEGIICDISDLSYVELDIKGVKATVKVIEKVLPPDELTGPCNLVATRGGVIEEILVLQGSPMTSTGSTVGKGDILISGVIEPPEPAFERIEPAVPQIVRARGIVRARVTYEGYGEHPLEEHYSTPTGRKANSIVLQTPEKKLVLRSERLKFKRYRAAKREYKLNTPWGRLSLIRRNTIEVKEKNQYYDPEKALDMARENAVRNLQKQMKGAEKIISTRTRIVSSPSDTVIRVVAMAEVLEDITRPLPINLEEK